MTYELWNELSGNRIDGGEDEAAFERLLQIVREIGHAGNLFIEVRASRDDLEPLAILRPS